MTKLKTIARAAARITSIEYGLMAGLLVVAGIYAAQGSDRAQHAVSAQYDTGAQD